MLIILISAILRFSILDDPNGLWYDELVSFKEASFTNILYIIFYTLKTDIHLPLYPLLLHSWGEIFSFADYTLRAFSAICGIITVLASYLIGKELKSKYTGLICASVFALNSFLIFYSQEVRVYSFLMLLSTLYLLFLVRIKNNYKNKWNYVAQILCSLAILNSSIFGFIFIFFQVLAFVIYIFFSKSVRDEKFKAIKFFLISNLILLILTSPILLYLCVNKDHYIMQINGFYCDWSSIFVVFQNWFTPVLNGLFNNPRHYMDALFSNLTFFNITFIWVPVLLSFYFIIYAIKKDKFSIALFIASLLFLLVQIAAFKFTNFKILPRYTSIAFPNILILVGYGLSRINFNKYLKFSFISIFLGIDLFYLVIMDDSAFRISRPGYRPLGHELNSLNIKDNDFLVVWNRTEILDKYVHKKLNVLSLLKNFAYSSETILENEDYLKKLPLDQRKTFLREYFADKDVPQNSTYLIDILYKHLTPGQKFIIVTNKHFDKFTQASFTSLVKNNQKYRITSFNDLLTIKALINLKFLCYEKFKLVKKARRNQFNIIVFEK